MTRLTTLTHSYLNLQGGREKGRKGGRTPPVGMGGETSEGLRDSCAALAQSFINYGCGALVVTAVNVVLLFLSFKFRDFEVVFGHVVVVRNVLLLVVRN